MNYYKNYFIQSILTFCFLCAAINLHAQCNCSYGEYTNSCEEEKIITGGVNGSNITTELHDAVMNNCRIRLANITGNDVTYFTFPQVFRDINHKDIVLDAGVTLVGLPGAATQCSQSVLTFDGHNVHDILIRGDYCDGEKKPSIEMGEPNYVQYSDVGYLVGADDSGDPYLNDAGGLNFVFSDGDNDPYFDNNGTPNFITNSSQLQVEKDCGYNDFLCNRKIVVWCPYTWEARNIISLHGVRNFWIEDLTIANGTGGDGIHITDDQDFNVSSEIQFYNLNFNSNTRNGLKITNAYCVDLKYQDFVNNGNSAPTYLVTPGAGLNLSQNTSPGSVDDYMGTLPNYALHNITLENGYFSGNTFNEISIDLPIDLSLCNEEAGFKASNICISESLDAIVFGQSSSEQGGNITFNSISINEFDLALKVSDDWLSEVMALDFDDWSVEGSSGLTNAFDINSPSFCTTATVSDICKSNSIIDDLCQPANCFTPGYSCSPNTDPKCNSNEEECELNVFTEVKKTFEYDCECDYLFMVDESGSVQYDEWDEMNCSITSLIAEVDSICQDSCDSRFSVIQWSNTDQQHLSSNFSCTPVDFNRWFHNGGTDVGDAISFLKDLLGNGEDFEPNKGCFKVVIFTDVGCYNFEDTDAGLFADLVKLCIPNVEFFIVDYSFDGQLANCDAVLDVIADVDGNANPNDVIQNEFDCETGIDVGDITDTICTYTIQLEIDLACIDPVITWTAYAGGEIFPPGTGTMIEVNGKGYYSVEVECASGCVGGIIEYIYFDENDNSSFKMGNQSVILKKGRTRYFEGKSYTPHEFEQLKLQVAEVPIENIRISPNPFVQELNIQIPQNTGNYNLKIFNTQGQIVYESEIKPANSTQVDLSDLSNGLYIVKLINNTSLESVSKKVLKLINN